MDIRRTKRMGTMAAALLVAAIAGGCSDDDGATDTATSTTTAGPGSGGAGGSGGSDVGGAGGSSGGAGGTGGIEAPEPYVVAAFDPGAGELPEGLAVRDGKAYVGFAPTGSIVTVDLGGTADVATFGSLPAPMPNAGFMTGFAFDASGQLFAALVSFAPDPPGGIYRLPAGGGAATLFASDAGMPFPNGLAFDASGDLFVTDSGAGAVLRIAPDGTVTQWAADPLLAGQLDFCGPDLNTFDIGANGIALGDDEIWVANNDKGSIVRIPVMGDGSAGTPALFAGPDCDRLGGADGIALDASGSIWVGVNRQNRLARVDADANVEVVAEGGALDFPASLALGDVAGEPSLLVTSFALGAAMSGGGPKPALVALSLAP